MDGHSDSDSEDFNKTFIDDPAILDKYKAASEVADKALKFVVSKCVPDADIAEICEAGDNFIDEEVRLAD